MLLLSATHGILSEPYSIQVRRSETRFLYLSSPQLNHCQQSEISALRLGIRGNVLETLP